jgi:hypothetical protein
LDNLDLNIISVINKDDGSSLEFTIGDSLKVFGSKIEIKLPFTKK